MGKCSVKANQADVIYASLRFKLCGENCTHFSDLNTQLMENIINYNLIINLSSFIDKKRETYHFSHKADLQNESLYNDLQPLSAERYDEARGPSIHKVNNYGIYLVLLFT